MSQSQPGAGDTRTATKQHPYRKGYSDQPGTPLWYADPTGHAVISNLEGDLILEDRNGLKVFISATDFRKIVGIWRFVRTQSGTGIRAHLKPSAADLLSQHRQ